MLKFFISYIFISSICFSQINSDSIHWIKQFNIKQNIPIFLKKSNSKAYFIRYHKTSSLFSDYGLEDFSMLIMDIASDSFVFDSKVTQSKSLKNLKGTYLKNISIDETNGDVHIISFQKYNSKDYIFYLTIFDSLFTQMKKQILIKRNVIAFDIFPIDFNKTDFPNAKYMGYFFEDGKRTEDSLTYTMYDKEFNILKNFKFRFPYYDKIYNSYSLQFLKNSTVIMLGVLYENKKELKSEDRSIIVFNYDFKTKELKEFKLPKSDSVILQRVYSYTSDSIVNFFCTYNNKRYNEKGKLEKPEFTDGLLNLSYNINKNNPFLSNKIAFSISNTPELARYTTSNNNLISLPENIKFEKLLYDFKNNFHLVFQDNQTKSNDDGVQYNIINYSHKKDFIFISISKDSLKIKDISIAKKDVYSQTNIPPFEIGLTDNIELFNRGELVYNLFLSYNTPFILYNDHIENVSFTENPNEYRSKTEKNGAVFQLKFDSTGAISKKLIFDYTKSDFEVFLEKTLILNNHKTLVWAYFKVPNKLDKLKLGILNTKLLQK